MRLYIFIALPTKWRLCRLCVERQFKLPLDNNILLLYVVKLKNNNTIKYKFDILLIFLQKNNKFNTPHSST